MTGARSVGIAVILAAVGSLLTSPPARADNAVPYLASPLVPAAAKPGGPDFPLTVRGGTFVSGATVYWNGSPRTTTFVSGTELTATINASDIAVPGTAAVTVWNPPPYGGFSNTVFFEITSPLNTVSFDSTTWNTGHSPVSVVTADFNRDGIQDLAVANEVDNTVSILLGAGNGTFQPQVVYATGYGPSGIAVGDFNNDGYLDLAVADSGENMSGQFANAVSVLLGNGNGTFQTHVEYPTGQVPVSVGIGDFNCDGKLDLAIVAQYDDAISILLGNGDGSFQPEIEYDVSSQPMQVVVTDFNGDGRLDLATANFGADSVSILLGNGDGTFQAADDFTASVSPSSIVAADFNGDGIRDLAVADFDSSAASILIGNGDGTFNKQVRYTAGTDPEAVTDGDFNGDGILDLALVTDDGLGSVAVLLGNGGGTFQSALSFPAGLLPVSIAAADFVGDGLLDVVTADVNANAVSVLLSTTLAASPTSINFGSINLGVTSSPQTVTLTNIAASEVTVTNIATSGPFSQTNTCGSTISAGANCSVSVTFTPTAAGSASGALTITDSAQGSPQSVALSGSGDGATVSFSPSSLNFGNQTVNSTSAGQTVTLTDTGNATLNITSITSTNSQYLIAGSTCGTTLTASSNCSFTVTFSPTQTGTVGGSVSVVDSGYGSPQTVALTGVGTQGIATLNPSSLTFGVQLLNTSSTPQTVTLTNTGTAPITITSISNLSSFTQTNTCGTTVAVGANCTITVTFDPTNINTLSGTINIYDNAASSPQTISVTGIGTQVSLNPASLNFGSVNLGTTSSAMTATLTNVGSTSVGITNVTITGTNGTEFAQTNTCGTSVGAGASCTFSITFAPGGTGTRTATLSVYDGGGGGPQTVALSGTGNSTSNNPVASFNPTSLSFGNQNYKTKSKVMTVTLTNTGGSALTITSILTGGDYTDSTTCPSSLAAGAICSISVTFTPTVVGTDNGSITVTDNASNSPQNVPLTGTGIGAAASLSPAALTYGLQVVGTDSAPQTVTLSNTGNAGLTVNSITIASNFIQTNDCNGSVAAGSSCAINVVFAPTVSGTPSGKLTVSDNSAGSSSQQVTLSGSSTIVSVVPTSLDFGSINLGTSSLPLTVVLTNVSTTQTLGSITESITGNDASDFAKTGSCGTSVPPLGTCTLSVTFTPGGAGSRSATLNFNDNGGGSPQTVALSGTGNSTGNGPVASFNPTSLNFGNQNYKTRSKVMTVTLTDTGSAALTITSIAAGGDYTETNTCPPSLSVGASCSISVTFTPTVVGTDNGALTVTDNASNSPQSVPLTGAGLGAQAVLSPTTLTFGVQLIGTSSAAQTTTLTNQGNASLTITSITAPKNFVQTNDCPSSLAAGATCTINVSFAPTNKGTLSGNLTVNDNSAGSASQKVSLSGTGTAMNVTPSSLNFGSVNLDSSSTPQVVSVTNESSSSVSITLVNVTGTNSTDFGQTNNCGSTLGAGATCTINVTFTPGGSGSRSATLNVNDNAGASPQTVALSGTGNASGTGPQITLSPTSLSFGNQNYKTASKSQTVTIYSTGTQAVIITSVTTSQSDFSVTSNNCPASLNPGSSCSVTVDFDPQSVGSINGTANVNDNASNSPQTVALSGTGLGALPAVSPGSLTFSTQVVNTSSPAQPVTLSNSGNASLTINSITTPSGFSQTNDCGSSVAAGASCTINVTFTPANSGVASGSLIVSDNGAGNTSQKVTLTGTGTYAELSPTSLNFGTVPVGESSTPQNVTLTNVNTVTSFSITSISFTGNDPGDFSQTNNCGKSLPASASCTITVTFTPEATGSRTASLSVADGAGGSPQTVAVSGTGQ